MAGSTATKRHNAQLERSYKRATGVKDERKGPRVQPGTIVTAAFLLFGLKALNTHVEDTHGISPWREANHWAGSGMMKVRRTLSKLISPRGGGGGGGSSQPRGNSSKSNSAKNFKGKGKKLGKR